MLLLCVCVCVPLSKTTVRLIEEKTSKTQLQDAVTMLKNKKIALKKIQLPNADVAKRHDPDDTLKRKTFELLYKMTKSSNVEVIVDRMIDYMISITDNHYKAKIASRCVELAEQFAPSNHWFIQTMNKVFEHAGDLVNVKVAHNLMRLIAEGFGEEDNGEDSQLRSSAVESYLRLIGEPKLPSLFLQVICWVLGEYGTADGKYSVSYITGKLCDVADSHSSDDIVKGYAVTSIKKVCAFDIASGRRVELLPECQSLIDELSASHSTDLQQRAYELQAVLGLDSQAAERIMPLDASCEDIELASPYIPEHDRSGMPNIGSLRSEDQREVSSHALRFEAYELPKPAVRPKSPAHYSSSSTDLVPIPEPTYTKETPQLLNFPSPSDTRSAMELKLRLDGVQKKWGHQSYSSSPSPSTSNSTAQKPPNGVTQTQEPREPSYTSKNSQPEINPEKKKLAASIFGGPSQSDRRSSTKTSRATSPALKKPELASPPPVQQPPPPPDLVDFGEPNAPNKTPSVDPFEQLEGLVGTNVVSNNSSVGASNKSGNDETNNLVSTVGNPVRGNGTPPLGLKKGPSTQNALEKHAAAR
ncbi:hypothetical protein ACHQM5_027944 [Ranunculus cassubicifolius]